MTGVNMNGAKRMSLEERVAFRRRVIDAFIQAGDRGLTYMDVVAMGFTANQAKHMRRQLMSEGIITETQMRRRTGPKQGTSRVYTVRQAYLERLAQSGAAS